ncbi:cupin domain-containing protein [Schauerella aestuarii]|uniref:cupin domain-containing protein n=1 Tax=Schauerella aestuarii TaxID=2511204 RepID=UPI00136C542C|nr:cupin domain-containing protein [Achromobacter aestuarii]MYZ43342.1 cupin domain-containing protein [Achromobacter aestuarii]
MTPQALVHHLALQPHPEGGFYRETYRSPETVTCADGVSRSASTAIYYLLCDGAWSTWHRIRSDETWHFHAGTALEVHELLPDGELRTHRLGADPHQTVFQATVQAGHWFAAEVADPASFALVGCTVAPGFEFSEFELADTDLLLQDFPAHEALIKRLARV